MKTESVWQREKRRYPKAEGSMERGIVVIGGGIAGFLTAFRLAEAGREVTLIEADRLFSGTTGRTTAKITANQGNVYTELYRRYGRRAVSLYYASQKEGMEGFAELVRKYNISCDWRETDGYIFSRQRYKIENLYNVLREAGAECEISEEIGLPGAECALKMKGQYLFDPLKFLAALPVKFEIYEQTRAVNIDAGRGRILTDNGEIRAETIIVATHYPIVNSHGLYFMKLRQSTSYTLAVGERSEGMYLDEREDGLSLRPYSGGTLIGGEDHRTGKPGRSGGFKALEKKAGKLFGKATVTHRWCAEDVMTFDGVPMVGRYAKNLDGVYVLTGFNKWGMTNAMTGAAIIRDILSGRENPYAGLFSPQRRIKGCFKAFLSNAAANAAGIFLGCFRITAKTAADIPAGSGKIVLHHGKRRAIYRDGEGRLHVIGSRCPHMRCELKWNGETNTWDCPCHGSRFDIYGNILSEPAVKSCKYEKEEGNDR